MAIALRTLVSLLCTSPLTPGVRESPLGGGPKPMFTPLPSARVRNGEHMEFVARILVVGDEMEAVSTMLRHLRREGFLTDSASEGHQACEKIRKARGERAPFDLVIVDVVMPNMDGLELLQWLQGAHPETSALLISTYGDLDEVIALIRPALDDYGQKPLTPQKMMALIDAIERKRKCHSLRPTSGRIRHTSPLRMGGRTD